MFFELINAFASFQTYINKTLYEYLNIFTLVYMNNILTYIEKNREYKNEDEFMREHIAQMKMILKKFHKYDLYVKLNKCNFHTKKINFLRFLISCFNIHMQEFRVTAIWNWFKLITHLQIQIFWKLTNFYWRFIDEFSCITVNLIKLLKNTKKKIQDEINHVFDE